MLCLMTVLNMLCYSFPVGPPDPNDLIAVYPTSTYNLEKTDIQLLARLLVAEVSSLSEPARTDAALSILDVVFFQLEVGEAGDTLTDLLTFQPPGSGYWAYPPWVVFGCEGLLDQNACMDDRPVEWAVEVTLDYLKGQRGSCGGYAAYHSMPNQPVDCMIADGTAFYAYFHRGWYVQTQPEISAESTPTEPYRGEIE